jgi:hypothetical protein
MNESYNGVTNDSPNRTNQSPTNHGNNVSRPNSRTSHHQQQQQHHQQHQQHSNNNGHHSNNNGQTSPHHSPLGSDTMLSGGSNYDSLRSILGSSPFDGALMNGVNSSNSGVNDIMLGAGMGSDSSSKLISSSSPALQSSLMSTSSPSHHLTQTTTAIPEIIFSGETFFLFSFVSIL